jgi:hypothetical protein
MLGGFSMGEPVVFDSEKFREDMAKFGAALEQSLAPVVVSMNTFATQLATAISPAIEKINAILELDWDRLAILMTLEHPFRYKDESLVDWAKRLERAGLFDQYEYRWMYQKECVRAMLYSPIWYSRELWWWLRHMVKSLQTEEYYGE